MRVRLAVAVVALFTVAPPPAIAQGGDPLRDHYERAQSLQRAGDLAAAEAEYVGEVLPRALRRLGNLSGAEGRVAEAIEALTAALELDPHDIDLQVDLATAWLRKPDFAQAHACAGQAVTAGPQHSRARAIRGKIRLLQGDVPGALEDLRIAHGAEARFDTRYALALAHLRSKNVDTARALFDPMLATGGATVRVLVARAYLDAGLLDEAATHLDDAVRRDPAVPGANDTRAKIEAARGAPPAPSAAVLLDTLPAASSADERQRAAMRTQLEDVIATARHNVSIIRTRRTEAPAPDDIDRLARERVRQEAGTLRDRALAAARAADLETALGAARELAALVPGDPDARYLLGITLLQNARWEEAVAALADVPAAARTDARWFAALGSAHFGRRDYEAARTAFEHTLTLESRHVEATFHLGLIAREQGRTAEAVGRMERAVALAPDHAAAQTELGAMHLAAGRHELARTHLERAASLDPDAPTPYYQLGLLFTRTGELDRARESMQAFQRARDKALARADGRVVKERHHKGDER
jgi:tetratricopeptide (TPR) repeat protein